jgi:hypothetical protein
LRDPLTAAPAPAPAAAALQAWPAITRYRGARRDHRAAIPPQPAHPAHNAWSQKRSWKKSVLLARFSSTRKKVSMIMSHAGFTDVIRRHVSVLENHEHPRPSGTGDRPGLQGHSGRKEAASRVPGPSIDPATRPKINLTLKL